MSVLLMRDIPTSVRLRLAHPSRLTHAVGAMAAKAGGRRTNSKQPPAPHARYMRQWRHKRRMAALRLLPQSENKRRRHRANPEGEPRCTAMRSSCAFDFGRLRDFQHWFRHLAQPHDREFQKSAELLRSKRLPLISLPSTYLAALISYWWLDDCGRDAIGWLLAMPEPSWQDVRRLLSIAAGTAAMAPVAKPRRRGLGALPADRHTKNRNFLSVKRWHTQVVGGNALAPLAQAITTKASQPKMSTSCAAAALVAVRGIGPYLAKNVINTLFSHGFLEFDVGIVGPGALATLAWLQGGSGILKSQGLLPASHGPQADIARQGVARLAEMESCHWLDMQHALCLWRCSGTGGPNR